MSQQERSHWVTHDQLDTPLCSIFPDTITTGTARLYVTVACCALGVEPLDLSQLSYEELNQYMDELDNKVSQL